MKLLMNKKYALPYRVLDGLVAHFVRFEDEEKELPVIWHQCLLTFVQRYDPYSTFETPSRLGVIDPGCCSAGLPLSASSFSLSLYLCFAYASRFKGCCFEVDTVNAVVVVTMGRFCLPAFEALLGWGSLVLNWRQLAVENASF
jgi:hypothetical protein